MSTTEITSKIEALKELEALIEEAKAEAETLRDEIKTEMLNRNTEEMEAGQYIVRWTPVLSQRFDSTAFSQERAVWSSPRSTWSPTPNSILECSAVRKSV